MRPKKSITELYQQGVLLSEAAIHFAANRLVLSYLWACKRTKAKGAAISLQQIATLRSDSAHHSTKAAIANNLGIDLNRLPNDPFCDRDPNKYLRVFKSNRSVPSEYKSRMESHLKSAMLEGKYAAIGYELPRTSKSPLVRIPVDVIQSFHDVNLTQSEIAGNGLEFAAVRILPADSFDPNYETGAPTGRRSRRPEIVSAFDNLVANKEIAADAGCKAICDRVRRLVLQYSGDGSGLSDDTIWRHVRDRHRCRKTGK